MTQPMGMETGTDGSDPGKVDPCIDAASQGYRLVIISKLTSKGQTTIPQSVRSALGVSAGDEIAYAIENGRVILTKAPVQSVQKNDPRENPFSTFWEWSSPEDNENSVNL